MIKKKSQSILDFVLTFVAIAGLSIGIVRIWIWFNANYTKRQLAFQQSRPIAGRPPSGNYTSPIDIGTTEDCPDCKYEPLDLTEEWVFKGEASTTVTGGEVGISPEAASLLCTDQCLGEQGCGDTAEEFNYECVCYVQCICNAQTSATRDKYRERATYFDQQAASLKNNADSMRDAANQCTQLWELCWWAGGGNQYTKIQLKMAAMHLDRGWYGFKGTAQRLEQEADRLRDKADNIEECCQKPTKEEQKICLDTYEVTEQRFSECYDASTAQGNDCREICDNKVKSGEGKYGFDDWTYCASNCDRTEYDSFDRCLAGPCKRRGEPCVNDDECCSDNCASGDICGRRERQPPHPPRRGQ